MREIRRRTNRPRTGGRTRRSAVVGPLAPPTPYRRTSRIYDRIYSGKDYAAEARRVRELVARWGSPDSRTLLDVACGTGEHLRHLSRWFRATGLDSSRTMLSVARSKVPRARFVVGAMQSFRLPERFDVLTCLFSSIGYVRSYADLERTLGNFARHLRPGGLAIVEPWLTPGEWRPGRGYLHTYGTEARPIARMHWADRRGRRSIMTMHYLVADGGSVTHWVEDHSMQLFRRDEMERAFRSAGLSVSRVASGFGAERGLYLGIRRR